MDRRSAILPVLFFLFLIPFYGTSEEVVSVLYFENLRGIQDHQWISKGIADSLISELAPVEGLTLVEREELQEVIDEQQLSLSGLTAADGAAELGRMLNAGFLVSGSFAVMGENIQVNCRITNTSSARIENSTTETIPFSSLPSLQFRLAEFVCVTLGYEIQTENPVRPSLTAMEHFYRGIDLFDRGQYREAVLLLEKAVSEEPAYPGPRKTLESCYTFLKEFKKARQTRELKQLAELLRGLQRRLSRKPFLTYGEIVRTAAARGATAEQLQHIVEENPALVRGNTPAEVLWNMQIVMAEIASKSRSYFNDDATADKMYIQIIEAARLAREDLSNAPFLPEILYQEMMVYVFQSDWSRVKSACEEIMIGWPDFRMNYAVEEYYQKALDRM